MALSADESENWPPINLAKLGKRSLLPSLHHLQSPSRIKQRSSASSGTALAPKPSMGVFDLTAAEHLICPAVTQAWGRSRTRLGLERFEAKSKLFLKLRPEKSELDGDRESAAVCTYELDHRHLVDECRSVSDARGVLWRGLVQTTRKPGIFAVFL